LEGGILLKTEQLHASPSSKQLNSSQKITLNPIAAHFLDAWSNPHKTQGLELLEAGLFRLGKNPVALSGRGTSAPFFPGKIVGGSP